MELVGECEHGGDAVAAIRRLRPDLVFLDVQMPRLGGFEVLESLEPNELPVVIFVTAFEEHALHAFEVDALDYLLKPFDSERFSQAMQRARRQVQLLRAGDARLHDGQLQALRRLARAQEYATRLAVKTQGRVYFVAVDEVRWIAADGRYVLLHTDDQVHQLRESMQRLETKLDPERFARIHRSTIVNLDAVRELQPMFHGDYAVLLHDGTELTLSRSYRNRLAKFLGPSV